VEELLELLTDNETVAGRAVTSAAILVAAVVVASVGGRIAAGRSDDIYSRYYYRKLTHYLVTVLAVIALAIVWRPFAGRLGLVLGLVTAGLAFAMQEVIGAFFGWVNILSGRIFRVGDRVQMGGVQGDVIDITPLRTKIMEIGSATDGQSWVRGRQYTGRIVAVSNKATFTDAVYNSSAVFDYIWEELTLPVAHTADWHQAERILGDEVRRISDHGGAEAAIDEMTRRYPVPRTEVEPRVFVRATDDYMELSARFVVPVRTARSAKDELTRRVGDRLAEARIAVASTTQEVTVHQADGTEG
jgi:small-conductance mechanosensitive channel